MKVRILMSEVLETGGSLPNGEPCLMTHQTSDLDPARDSTVGRRFLPSSLRPCKAWRPIGQSAETRGKTWRFVTIKISDVGLHRDVFDACFAHFKYHNQAFPTA